MLRSLQNRLRSEWQGKVELLFGDMRQVNIPEKADILVSELLGSFGDNELSPECLDGAMRFLKREPFDPKHAALHYSLTEFHLSRRYLDTFVIYCPLGTIIVFEAL